MRKTGRPGANLLDTVAAGYAATGRFEDAVRMAARAVEAAEARGGAQLGKEIRGRLALYQTGRPYTETTSASGG